MHGLIMLVNYAFIMKKMITLPTISMFSSFLMLFEGFFTAELLAAVWA